jgi:hypothetical protein
MIIMPSDELQRLLEVQRAHAVRLLALPNVRGLAVGYKQTGGNRTGELAVLVYVQEKIHDRDILPPRDRAEIPGVVTDVVQWGPIRCGTARTPVYAAEQDPLRGGYSVGRANGGAGTIGAICAGAEAGDQRVYVLSNNHVLATFPDGSRRDVVYQPALSDGGTREDAIGSLTRKVSIRYPTKGVIPWNQVDGAVVSVDPLNVEWSIADIGQVTGINTDPPLGTRVRKTGRTTGCSAGEIIGINGYTAVVVDGSTAYFDQQLIVGLKCDLGDSGSLVVDEENRAVGLLFAVAETYAVVNPIAQVQRQLRVEVARTVSKPDPDDPGMPAALRNALETMRKGLAGVPEAVAISVGRSRTDEATIDVRVTAVIPLPARVEGYQVRMIEL